MAEKKAGEKLMFLVSYNEHWGDEYPWCVSWVDEDSPGTEPEWEFHSKQEADVYAAERNKGEWKYDALRAAWGLPASVRR